jgi:hypothetical protein
VNEQHYDALLRAANAVGRFGDSDIALREV